MKRMLLLGLVFSLIVSLCGCSVPNNQQCAHNIVADNEVLPSCNEKGLSAGSHCSICGEVIVKQQPVAPLGHTTSAGTCERCGESFGAWTVKYYVDEFNDPTSQKYITTELLLNGTFSNTATTNSKLTAKILVDSVFISFILYEYGSQQVKSGISDEYRISIKYGYHKTTIYGNMRTDRIAAYGSADEATLLEALTSGDTVTFYIEDTKYRTSNYLFSVESSNFKDLYNKTFGATEEADKDSSSTPEGEHEEITDDVVDIDVEKVSAEIKSGYLSPKTVWNAYAKTMPTKEEQEILDAASSELRIIQGWFHGENSGYYFWILGGNIIWGDRTGSYAMDAKYNVTTKQWEDISWGEDLTALTENGFQTTIREYTRCSKFDLPSTFDKYLE